MPTNDIFNIVRRLNCFRECEFVGGAFSDEGVSLLVEAFEKNTTVRTLKFTCDAVSDGDVVKLVEIFKINKTIDTVEFSFNELGHESLRALSKLIEENQTILYLLLQFNRINSEGVRLLAESLKLNKRLRFLSLRGNIIGSEGACALAEALKENRGIRILDLYGCFIGDEGVEALTKALVFNTSIFEINICDNKITNKGEEYLALMLKNNLRLISLGHDYDKKWGHFLERNKKIAPYLDLLFSLERVALDRKIPEGEEKNNIEVQVKKLNDRFLFLDKTRPLESLDGYIKLLEIIESSLMKSLKYHEFLDFNCQSYGVRGTKTLLCAWKAESEVEQSISPRLCC